MLSINQKTKIIIAISIIINIILLCILIGLFAFGGIDSDYCFVEEIGDKADFYFQFSRKNKIIYSGVVPVREPIIDRIGKNTYLLEKSQGSNDWYAQFVDTKNASVTEPLRLHTGYDWYYARNFFSNKNNTLVVYLDSEPSDYYPPKSYLIIKTVFNDSFETRIDRDFVTPISGLNELRFINDHEIYLSYNRATGPDKYDSVVEEEIIRFR